MQNPNVAEPINHSTGPRTEEGKQRSSRNAVTHGVFAQQLVFLNGETQEQFDALFQGYIDDLQPEGTIEMALVYELAHCHWRKQRIIRFEARAMQKAEETGDTECKGLDKWAIYSQRITREIQVTLKTFKDVQSKRLEVLGQDFRVAVLMHDYYTYNKIPWDPADDGFVFSRETLERQLTFNKVWLKISKQIVIYPTTKYMDERFSRLHRVQPNAA